MRNERFIIETNLSWAAKLFHAKILYHRQLLALIDTAKSPAGSHEK
jgi:hypothetical protein